MVGLPPWLKAPAPQAAPSDEEAYEREREYERGRVIEQSMMKKIGRRTPREGRVVEPDPVKINGEYDVHKW